jgi:hypothetical protein
MKPINEIIYWYGMVGISCLNRLLHEVLGCVPAMILKIYFCKVLEELPPQNYFIFYNRMTVCIVNSFESVNVTAVDH